jgi:hypothetical protein
MAGLVWVEVGLSPQREFVLELGELRLRVAQDRNELAAHLIVVPGIESLGRRWRVLMFPIGPQWNG